MISELLFGIGVGLVAYAMAWVLCWVWERRLNREAAVAGRKT